MRKALPLLLALLWSPLRSPCQMVTVTAQFLQDSSGNFVTGTIYFAPAVPYRMGSGGQVVNRPVSATVSAGIFTIQLPDTSQTYPRNVCFNATISSNTGGTLGAGYTCVQPAASNSWCTSSACNFDNYIPNSASFATAQPYVATINGLSGTFIFNGCTQVGTTFTCGGGGSMTWPSLPGIVQCTGTPCTAWGTSYSASNIIPANFLPSTLVYTGQANTFGAFLQDLSAASVKMPAGFLSGDCTWTAAGAITCTKSAGTPFASGAFAAAYVLPGTVVQTNQANTYGNFLQDFSAGTTKLPAGFLSGDCTWTALGVITCTKSGGTAFGTAAFVATSAFDAAGAAAARAGPGTCGTSPQQYEIGDTTGTPSCAQVQYSQLGGTIPTWNQNTTGSAASLSISGQTGLLSFTGLTTLNRIKTVRDAADTILELGGSYTPTGTWNWASCSGCTWPTFNQSTTGNAATATTATNFSGSLSGDVTGTQSAAVVGGLKSVPFCTGFTPTNGQFLQYTTASSPSPCYTAAASGSSSLPLVTPEQYGAVGNGANFFDGVTTLPTGLGSGNGSTTTPTAPAVSTEINNEVTISVFKLSSNAGTWTPPGVGTNRVSLTPNNASSFPGIFVYDQAVPAAGSVSAVSGTIVTSSSWIAATISIVPPASGTITFNSASSHQQNGSTSIAITAPTGITAGDRLVACIEESGASSLTTPSGFVLIQSNSPGATFMLCYEKIASASEPTTYTWSSASMSGGAVGSILDYQTTLGAEGAVLSSASAGFVSGQLHDPIAIAATGASSAQGDGYVMKVSSSTSIETTDPIMVTGSSLQFDLGTNDWSAFNTMLTTAPCSTVGCTAELSCKHYVFDAALNLPTTAPVTLNGCGTGWNIGSGNLLPVQTNNIGSSLDFLSQAPTMSPAAVNVGGAAQNYWMADTIENLSIICGVGTAMDGGNGDGLQILNWKELNVDKIMEQGCSGWGITDDGAASPNTHFTLGINVTNSLFMLNGKGGGRRGGIGNSGNLETATYNTDDFQQNGGPAFSLANGDPEGTSFINTVMQYNNYVAAGPEFVITVSPTVGTAGGCAGIGMYFEINNGVGTSKSNNAYTPGQTFCDLNPKSNYFRLLAGSPVYTSGTVALTSGAATVSTIAACTQSNFCRYTVNYCNAAGTGTVGVPAVTSVTAGTSFTISALDPSAGSVNTSATGTVCWGIN